MKLKLTIISFVSLYLLALSGCVSMHRVPDDMPMPTLTNEYMLTNVNIVDVKTGQIIENQVLHIKGERIHAISSDNLSHLNIPTIEGNNAYVTPGLVDMHVHLYDRKDLVANLVHGVTTVRNLMGFPMHLRWREEIKQKEWLGATPIVSSPVLNGEQNSHLLQEVVTESKAAQQKVREYQEAGYDLLKFYGFLEPDVFDAMMETAVELDMPVAKHGPYSPGKDPYRWLDKMQSLEHVEDIFQGPLNFEFNEAKLAQYIEDIKPVRPFIVPTLTAYDHLTQLSEYKHEFVNGIAMQQHNRFFRWLKQTFRVNRWLEADQNTIDWNKKVMDWLMITTLALYEAEIPLLVGSDAGVMFTIAGESTHREMQLMQAAGIPAKEVLKSATWLPAIAMKMAQQSGSVEAGKIADLVLVSGNPLENIETMQTPVAVIKQGQFLNEVKLHEMRQTLDNPSSFMTGLSHLVEHLVD